MTIASRRTVYLMLLLVMLLWSGNSIVARAIHEDVPPFTLAFLRWTGAALIAIPIAWRFIRADWVMVRRHWLVILLLGAIGIGSFNAFMYSGLQYTTAANSLLVQAGIPALVLLFDRLIFRTRARLAQVAGCIVAAVGVLLIVFRGDPAALAALHFNRGDALVLVASMLWALYTVLLRLRPAINGLSFLALTICVGVIAMAPFSAIELQTRSVTLSPGVIAGVAYIALFPSVIANFLFNTAVGEIGAADAGQVVNLQPLFGAALASLILGEDFGWYHVTGMVVILFGIGAPLVLGAKGSKKWSR